MTHERLGVLLIVLLSVITVVSVLARMAPSGNEVGRLGVVGGVRGSSCSGELTVTSKQVGEKCGLQTDLIMYNCEGKKWYVFQGNSCSGTYICTGSVNEPMSKWRCSWEADKGTYAFTLCADSDAKITRAVSC